MSKKYISLMIVLLIAIISCKVICFFTWPNTMVSILYYILMAGFCFLSGRIKQSTMILGITFAVEMIPVTILSFVESAHEIGWLQCMGQFVVGSHAGLVGWIGSYEGVCETLPEWVYWAGIVGSYVVFMAVNIIGRRYRGKQWKS